MRRALADQGLEGQPFTGHVTCTPFPANCHSGTSVITVRVFSSVDVPLLPDVLGGEAPSFALDAAHTVPIGQYQEVDRAAVTLTPRRARPGHGADRRASRRSC